MNLPEIDYSRLRPTDWLPTSVKEMKALGWHCVDVVLFSGDAPTTPILPADATAQDPTIRPSSIPASSRNCSPTSP